MLVKIIRNIKTITTVITIAFAVFGYFYVKSALDENKIRVEEKKPEEKGFEEKPAEVTLTVVNNNVEKTFSRRLKNTDTVLDFIEDLRKENEIIFDKVAYIHGVEIENVDGVASPDGQRWLLYLVSGETKKDVTFEIGKYNLTDGDNYLLILGQE